MKREKPEPLLDDVSLCVQMGWTHEELMRQPVRFVEKLRIYLDAIGDRQERERRRLEEEIERLRRR
ncbi:MAG: hypothetical protein NWF12_06755 [Candidatus Bathyarchaeota archaeon]|nr:hypothetical protein [Candidatus Bathyarchaeota archaeon]